MPIQVKITVKGFTKKQAVLKYLEYSYEKEEYILSDFLKETVLLTLKEYEKKQESTELLKVLSLEEIEEKKENGKISFDVIYNEKKPQEEKAVKDALLAFEDGLIAVFVDNRRVEKLDDTIVLTSESIISFIRLTFLAGRLW